MSELLNQFAEASRILLAAQGAVDALHYHVKTLNEIDLRDQHRRMVQVGVDYGLARDALHSFLEFRTELARKVSETGAAVDILASQAEHVAGEIEHVINQRRRAGV